MMMEHEEEFYKVYPYIVPSWASHLQNIPKYRVKLSNMNTPIHPWNLPGVPDRFSVSIKRDDLTGCGLSGNKVRNLEFIFSDVLLGDYRHVVTAGGRQSGFCRAVTTVARLLGVTPHILISRTKTADDLDTCGNSLLYKLSGAHIYLQPEGTYDSLIHNLDRLTNDLSETLNESCFQIAMGGTSTNGVFGYLSMFEELVAQGVHERFDDIVIAIGSGGTAAGLAIGNFLTGSKLRVHAVTVAYPKDVLIRKIDGIMRELGLRLKTENIMDIIDGYGGKFGIASDIDLEIIAAVSASTGIVLDPSFTSKSTRGMLQEFSKHPRRFKGSRILYIHSGGIFGLFDGQINKLFDDEKYKASMIHEYPATEMEQ